MWKRNKAEKSDSDTRQMEDNFQLNNVHAFAEKRVGLSFARAWKILLFSRRGENTYKEKFEWKTWKRLKGIKEGGKAQIEIGVIARLESGNLHNLRKIIRKLFQLGFELIFIFHIFSHFLSLFSLVSSNESRKCRKALVFS